MIHAPLLVEATDLAIGYEGERPLLEGSSFQIFEGDFVGIVGPNGGGKTTLVRTLLGLIKPRAGSLRYTREVPIGYVPQQSRIDVHFPISVTEVVGQGVLDGKHLRLSQEQKRQVSQALTRVDMKAMGNTPIGELSGGQLQRVLLARALVSNPELLILDEPNTYIDKEFEHQLYHLLAELKGKVTILVVSHAMEELRPLLNRLFYVNREFKEYAPTDTYHR